MNNNLEARADSSPDLPEPQLEKKDKYMHPQIYKLSIVESFGRRRDVAARRCLLGHRVTVKALEALSLDALPNAESVIGHYSCPSTPA
jgi:hypothetical protein